MGWRTAVTTSSVRLQHLSKAQAFRSTASLLLNKGRKRSTLKWLVGRNLIGGSPIGVFLCLIIESLRRSFRSLIFPRCRLTLGASRIRRPPIRHHLLSRFSRPAHRQLVKLDLTQLHPNRNCAS